MALALARNILRCSDLVGVVEVGYIWGVRVSRNEIWLVRLVGMVVEVALVKVRK